MDFTVVESRMSLKCIVCNLRTETIAELHRHQTYCHTTEELSLSSICLYCCSDEAVVTRDMLKRSGLYDPRNRFKFYVYSAKLLNKGCDLECHIPVDCVLKKERVSEDKDESAGSNVKFWGNTQKLMIKRIRNRNLSSNYGVLDLSRRGSTKIIKPKKKSKLTNVVKKVIKKEIPSKKQTRNRLSVDAPEKKLDGKKRVRENQRKGTGKGQGCKLTKAKPEKVELAMKQVKKRVGLQNSGIEPTDNALVSKDLWEDMDDEIEETCAKKSYKRKEPKARYSVDSCPRRYSKRVNNLKIVSNGKDDSEEINWSVETKLTKINKAQGAKDSTSEITSGAIVQEATSPDKRMEKLPVGDSNFEKSTIDEICVDRNSSNVSIDSSAKAENSSSEPSAIYPTNLVSGSDHEVSLGPVHNPDSVNTNLDSSKTENFTKVESFPAYPLNMDERSILVYDPVIRKLVWTSFEVIDDNYTGSNEIVQSFQDIEVSPELDSMVFHDYLMTNQSPELLNHLLATPGTPNQSSSQCQPETNGESLENRENLWDVDFPSGSGLTPQNSFSSKLEQQEDLTNSMAFKGGRPEIISEALKNAGILSDMNFSSSPKNSILREKLLTPLNFSSPKSQKKQRASYSKQDTNGRISKSYENLPNVNMSLRPRRICKASPLKKSYQKQDTSVELKPEANKETLIKDENSGRTNVLLRSRRIRSTPNRYVPF